MNPPLQVFADLLQTGRPSPNWLAGVFDANGITVARVPDNAHPAYHRHSAVY